MSESAAPRVLLTGASAGIGLEIARRLTAHGCEVWGTSREPARLPPIPRFHGVTMDLLHGQSIREGLAAALAQAPGFDVLINNAGAGVFGPAETVGAELAQEQFQLLVHGPMELIRRVLPHMREQQRGRILNLTSLAGEFPIPYLGAYCAAKAALSAYSRCLRLELAHTPIHVVDVQPGDICTGFHRAMQRVFGQPPSGDPAREAAVWEAHARHMAAAPPPRRVAETVWRVIQHPDPPPVVTVGGWFQASLGPLAARFGSRRWVDRVLAWYYGC